jgi:hypothetical protein
MRAILRKRSVEPLAIDMVRVGALSSQSFGKDIGNTELQAVTHAMAGAHLQPMVVQVGQAVALIVDRSQAGVGRAHQVADRAAADEITIQRSRDAGSVVEEGVRVHVLVAVLPECGPMEIPRTGLDDHVDGAAGSAPVFRLKSIGQHPDLRDRIHAGVDKHRIGAGVQLCNPVESRVLHGAGHAVDIDIHYGVSIG